MKFNFVKENAIFDQKKNDFFLDLLEILCQSSETHISYQKKNITLKWVVLAPKTSAKFLTVKMQVLQKFVYQLF